MHADVCGIVDDVTDTDTDTDTVVGFASDNHQQAETLKLCRHSSKTSIPTTLPKKAQKVREVRRTSVHASDSTAPSNASSSRAFKRVGQHGSACVPSRAGANFGLCLPQHAYVCLSSMTGHGCNVVTSCIPCIIDAGTPGIYMDAMGFGMGMCCLQVTFQARDVAESRHLYDALAVLAPIFQALTAATPIM